MLSMYTRSHAGQNEPQPHARQPRARIGQPAPAQGGRFARRRAHQFVHGAVYRCRKEPERWGTAPGWESRFIALLGSSFALDFFVPLIAPFIAPPLPEPR